MKEIAYSEGFHEGDGKEGESVEGEAGDLKLMGQVMNPRVKSVADDAVRWIILHEILNESMEKHRSFIDLAGGVKTSCGGQTFDT
ncbi:hypothetical protein A2U01_0057617, partial [Trifolium medium]|nr:hypothetical protein [Trifolium medium]